MKKIIFILMFVTLISCNKNNKETNNEVKEKTISGNDKTEVKKEETKKEETMKIESNIEVIDGVTYVNKIIIVNKKYSLPSTYAPGLNEEALNAFNEMQKKAQEEGINFSYFSAYRSYEYQEKLFNDYVARDGIDEANKYSAKPGHSEHQTGLTFDITDGITENTAEESFKNTPQGKWLKENAHKYGFILRYPEGKESITGYIYEPWHFRYVGEIAKSIFEKDQTLEEYLNIK